MTKHENNAVKAVDRRSLRQAFTAYTSNKVTKELQPLPWCIGCLELVATVDMAQDPPVHPADTFPFDSTTRTNNCSLVQWVSIVQDICISMGEEQIKISKPGATDLKDFFCCLFSFETRRARQ